MERVDVPNRLFAFYLVPNFTMLALSSAVEILRLANIALGKNLYAWRLVSADGAKVKASCGLTIEVDNSLAAERRHLSDPQRPFMAVICGGGDIEQHTNIATAAWLRECRQRGVEVASFCNGTYVLARAGLLNGRECTIHWENYPGFVERFGSTFVSTGLYAVDGGVHTCAGGTAAIDMVLNIVKHDCGDAVVTAVCERALVDRIRQPTDRQRLPFATRMKKINPTIVRLIEKMQDNLAEPLALAELAETAKLSRRQVERLFNSEMKSSPHRYYLKLRLDRARLLLLQTWIPVLEVAVATGFVSASHFSRCYRVAYGCSPQETRNTKTAGSAAHSHIIALRDVAA